MIKLYDTNNHGCFLQLPELPNINYIKFKRLSDYECECDFKLTLATVLMIDTNYRFVKPLSQIHNTICFSQTSKIFYAYEKELIESPRNFEILYTPDTPVYVKTLIGQTVSVSLEDYIEAHIPAKLEYAGSAFIIVKEIQL